MPRVKRKRDEKTTTKKNSNTPRTSDVMYTSDYFLTLSFLVILFEVVANIAIIAYVPYTEIDWKAYMEEVSGVIVDGELDYMQLKGGTGPLVYPAGFVWLYSILYYLTDSGENIMKAQIIFGFLNVCFTAVLLLIYNQVRKEINFPTWGIVLLCISRRIHSIFALRLFNDCWAMFFLYIAIYFYTKYRWTLGSIFITIALSIKMNILLFFPPLLVILVKSIGIPRTFLQLLLIFLFQTLVGAPFLLHNYWSYLVRSFDFGREFMYVWSVNLKFLPEEIFLSKSVSRLLLIGHLSCLILFGLTKWCKEEGGVIKVLLNSFNMKTHKLTSAHVVNLLFVGNFIGIFFSRSLHYQFYVWYYHTLPFLLWNTPFPTYIRLGILACIEIIWNIFPSNFYSSLTLCLFHHMVLGGLIWSPPPPGTIPLSRAQNESVKSRIKFQYSSMKKNK